MRVKRLLALIILMMIGFTARCLLVPSASAQVLPSASDSSSRSEAQVLLIYNSPEPSGEIAVMESLLRHFPVDYLALHSAELEGMRLQDVDYIIFFDSIRTSRLDRDAVLRIIEKLNIPYMVFSSGAADESFIGIEIQYRDVVYPSMPIHAAPAQGIAAGVTLAVISDGREERPLIIENGYGWFVQCKLERGLVSWIVADVLHDFLGVHHIERLRGMFIIEQVSPLIDAEQLRQLADLLGSRGIPFVVAIEPVYRSIEDGRLYTVKDDPAWVEAVRYMVESGGTIVLDGSKLESLEPTDLAYRIDQGIAFLYEIGVYPIALYASQETKNRLESVPNHAEFSTILAYSHRRLDESRYTDIPFDYAADDARIMYPVSIGTASSEASVNQLITRARTMMLVRDAWLGFGVDAAQPYELAEFLLGHLTEEPIMWMDIRYNIHKVDAGFVHLQTDGSGLLDIQLLNRNRLTELVKVELNTYTFESFTYYSTWILVLVVGVFVVLFILFVVLMRIRRRRRLFSEKELE